MHQPVKRKIVQPRWASFVFMVNLEALLQVLARIEITIAQEALTHA